MPAVHRAGPANKLRALALRFQVVRRHLIRILGHKDYDQKN
jgi:hypothetical protein